MTPEEQAREVIDRKLLASGWIIQDMKQLNLTASLGIAVREFSTSTGPVDYALFVNGKPVGVVEAKKSEDGENITVVEGQSARYAGSTFKWVRQEYKIRFAYEATDKLVRFTDYDDIKYRSRTVFSFHRLETLKALLVAPDTVRNNMKHFPPLDETGFRKCQIKAIHNLDQSFAENRPKALVQMATGAGKTFTAITAAYRRAVEKLTVLLVKSGALHAIRLRQKFKSSRKKKIAAAVYEYHADCDGEWGKIQFDFENGTAEIVRLAEWDTMVTNIFAKRAIQFLLACGADKLPKETMTVFER